MYYLKFNSHFRELCTYSYKKLLLVQGLQTINSDIRIGADICLLKVSESRLMALKC